MGGAVGGAEGLERYSDEGRRRKELVFSIFT